MAQDWRKALKDHNEDEYAHSTARHAQTNEWVSRFQIPILEMLESHRKDEFAHNAMTSRLLGLNTFPLVKRVESLERFRAQAIVLGGIGMLLLGATAAAVATKLLGL